MGSLRQWGVLVVGVALGLAMAVPMRAQSQRQIRRAMKVLEKIKLVDGSGSGLDADSVQGMSPAEIGSAALTPEGWHETGGAAEPGFRGGAVNARPPYVCSGPDPQPPGCPQYETAGFYKDPAGVVHLKGSIALGIDTIPFTLPAGYHPGRAVAFRVTVNPDRYAVLVVYDEFVQILQPGGYSGDEIYSLDNVSFRAAG